MRGRRSTGEYHGLHQQRARDPGSVPQPSDQPRLQQRQRGGEQGSYIDHLRSRQLGQDSGLERTNGTRLFPKPSVTSA